MKLPVAIKEFACTISKHGTDIMVQCDNHEDAEELFDWINELSEDTLSDYRECCARIAEEFIGPFHSATNRLAKAIANRIRNAL